MKIMSFNTQHCFNYVTKKIDYERMAEAIAECSPDIVGLNEMRGVGKGSGYQEWQVERLAKLTGMSYYYFAPAINPEETGPYGNGLLSKIPIVKAETIMIPDPEKKPNSLYYETRCLIKAELLGGVCVLITHMGLNPDERYNAVSTVVDNLSDTKCILMGDFNMSPSDSLLLPIIQRMKDTAVGFCENKFSFPSDAPYEKIDYIFVSSDAVVSFADIPPIVASDHRPHIATVDF